MSDENNAGDGGEGEVSKNPALDKATNGGWRPEEEWQGKPEDWIDYREFNVRGELMGRIQEQSSILNKQSKQLDEHRASLKDMAELSDKLAEREYDKLMKVLQKAKAEAIDESEGETVVEIDEQIEQLKAQRDERNEGDGDTSTQDTQTGEDLPPAVTAWLADPQNQWYHNDPFMKTMADAVAQRIVGGDDGIDPATVLTRMEAELRKELPHKFGDQSSGKPQNVVGSGDGHSRPRGGSKRQRVFADLNEDEQNVARRMVKTGTLTIEKYIEKLDSLGE